MSVLCSCGPLPRRRTITNERHGQEKASAPFFRNGPKGAPHHPTPFPRPIAHRLLRFFWNRPYSVFTAAALAAAAAGLAEELPLPKVVWVSPQGRDSNPGTRQQPLATLEAARDRARRAGPAPRRIVVMAGEYFLASTLQLDARDSGLTIEAEGGTATLYGGRLVAGWRPDGDRFWCADLPGVQEGTWDFRALVVNGRMPERARWPASGTCLHRSVFDVRWLSSVGGGWERPPTQEELTTMLYDPKDIPPTLDVRNAEVRVYHMWDESLVGVARNDTARGALIFSTPAKSPPGAFGVKKYVIWNTREGLTRPGQWYLDRTAGRLVYWPLPGEDMARAKVVAPVLERIMGIQGSPQEPAERITLRGLALQATTTPLKPGGFGAYAFDGALGIERARECVLEKMEICNVGGQGILARQVEECRITDCHVHHTGGCAIKADGSSTLIARNHLHHVGVYHPSAIALSVAQSPRGERQGFHLYRNEIHDAPYSGIVGSGGNHLIEENLISRVMREMQDGGAIYGGMRNTVLRGNLVRDVVKVGEGYGVSAYYLDEGAEDCIVERNVSVGVERPVHNHIARNLIIRDNVFLVDGDMTLSFQRSAKCAFEGNTLFVPGKITVGQPSAIQSWKNNVVFRNAQDLQGAPQAFTIDGAMPRVPPPQRKSWAAVAARVGKPPTLDGEIGWDEWPGGMLNLDREPSRWSAAGAPVFAELCRDDRCLYVAVNVVMFDVAKLRRGTAWGKDDGAEIALAGTAPDGKPAVFVLRGFAGGALQSVTEAGAPAEAAARLHQAVLFAAKPYGKGRGGWRGEWAIPLESLGLKPSPGQIVPFNLAVFRAEDEVWRCWEGTLGETWRLDQAGMLQFR